ncbi:MAG: HAMP domain-containing histidine kinase [Planctomycetes bacterium]|nr:HAMP domain-containing histidine kinase [Planctomycetota bacterium]
MEPSSADSVRPDDAARALARAERLLACYQQAVGHELPNLLVALQGTARMLEQDAGDRLDAETRTDLVRVSDLAARVHDFIAALAEVGRICRRVEPPAELSLEDVCREAAAEAGWLCPRPVMRYDMLQPMPTLALPPGAARRVFVELFLHAARRGIPESGSPEKPIRIEVSALVTPDGTEVRVEDDGPAPGSLRLRQAFDPFAAPPDQGPSFGLFLARQLVEGWGGTLCLEPTPSEGCRAVVTVPSRTTGAASRDAERR